nr:unnamed protein product [Digitaria exilis]
MTPLPLPSIPHARRARVRSLPDPPRSGSGSRPLGAERRRRRLLPSGPATPCHLRLAPPGAATSQHLPPPPGTLAALASDARPPLAAPTARRNGSSPPRRGTGAAPTQAADVVHLVAMDSSGCPIWIDPGNAFRLVVKVSKYVADGEYGNVEMTNQEHDLWFDRTELFTLEKFHDEMATKIIWGTSQTLSVWEAGVLITHLRMQRALVIHVVLHLLLFLLMYPSQLIGLISSYYQM